MMPQGQPKQLFWCQDHPSCTFGNLDSAEGGVMPPLPGQHKGKVCPCVQEKSLLVHMMIQCNYKSAQSPFACDLHFLNRWAAKCLAACQHVDGDFSVAEVKRSASTSAISQCIVIRQAHRGFYWRTFLSHCWCAAKVAPFALALPVILSSYHCFPIMCFTPLNPVWGDCAASLSSPT